MNAPNEFAVRTVVNGAHALPVSIESLPIVAVIEFREMPSKRTDLSQEFRDSLLHHKTAFAVTLNNTGKDWCDNDRDKCPEDHKPLTGPRFDVWWIAQRAPGSRWYAMNHSRYDSYPQALMCAVSAATSESIPYGDVSDCCYARTFVARENHAAAHLAGIKVCTACGDPCITV